MIPIIACSVISLAIIFERLWTLRRGRVVPAKLVAQVWQMYKSKQLSKERLNAVRADSPLGRVLAAGLGSHQQGREAMQHSLEEEGRKVVLKHLERFLTALGTIAVITPLLGLLGTVIGMIKVFAAITAHGVGNPGVLAGGISEALITTAAGLSVAIPTLIFHRHFQRKIDALVMDMEEEAMRLVDMVKSRRGKPAADPGSGERR